MAGYGSTYDAMFLSNSSNMTFPFDTGNFSFDYGLDFLSVLKSFKQNMLTVNDTTTIILISLYAPVFLTAVIGNITVLFVIIPNRRMWSVTNNFLLNLALADLLVTFVCIPMTLADRIYKLWIYGELLCKLTPFLQGVAVAASTFTIASMSVDRCLAIRHPMRFRNFRTTKYVRIVIIVIWCMSILLSLPLLIVRVTVSEEIIVGETFTYCTESWKDISNRQVYDVCLLVFIFMIPGGTILICYILMGRRLWVPDRKLSDDVRKPTRKRSDCERERSVRNVTTNRRRLAKLCITIAIVFIACWTPFFIVTTYLNFKMEVDKVDILSYTLLIGHVHCVTNPILYCFLHKSFRHYIVRCLASSAKKQPTKTAQGYMTFYRSTPFRSLHRSSCPSISVRSIRRPSSSSSGQTRRLEEISEIPKTAIPTPVFNYRKSIIAKIKQGSDEEQPVEHSLSNGNGMVRNGSKNSNRFSSHDLS